MSKLREAAQQVVNEHEAGFVGLSLDKAVAALRAALAEPTCKDHLHVEPVQEPVAWRYQNANTDHVYLVWEKGTGGRNWTPLYTRPQPAREWQGLTDEAIWIEYQRFWPFHPAEEPRLAKDISKFAKVIEAKLKEKNT